MSEPINFLTERAAAQAAIKMLESGQVDGALRVLRQALSRRKPPKKGGTDHRSRDIVRLRAYIEQAIVELEHGDAGYALTTLRNGVNPKPT